MPSWAIYIIFYAVMVLAPYLLCGINTAIIVTKIKTGKDIRTMGSGNAGLTNTYRTQGKAAAACVLLGDVLKGVLSVLVVKFTYLGLFGIYPVEDNMSWVLYAAGVFAILGHVFPIYFGFKGGKGVLVTVSVLFAIDWLAAAVLLGIFAIIVALTRYVSLGSIIAAICYPIAVLIFDLIEKEPCYIANALLAAVIGGLIVLMHRSNIVRLKNHTEKKLGEKRPEETT